jgi:hypothetical protein
MDIIKLFDIKKLAQEFMHSPKYRGKRRSCYAYV